ncbi:hypothetical protein JTB14_000106 [Gonioctena quinquepunctata]|nr:hypothetical protein JTB14_000106 [Gonioctena quinquepunctata]
MPRTRPRKTHRGNKDLNLHMQAYEEITKGKSVRAATAAFDLCHVSLRRYKQKRDDAKNDPATSIEMGYRDPNKILTDDRAASQNQADGIRREWPEKTGFEPL